MGSADDAHAGTLYPGARATDADSGGDVMFLCEKCHAKQGWCTKSAILHSQSYGRCERCGAVAGCLDCHRYDFRVPPAVPERRPQPPAQIAEKPDDRGVNHVLS